MNSVVSAGEKFITAHISSQLRFVTLLVIPISRHHYMLLRFLFYENYYHYIILVQHYKTMYHVHYNSFHDYVVASVTCHML